MSTPISALLERKGHQIYSVPSSSTVAEAVEGSNVKRRYTVVVGKVDRPSPTLTTMITTVNLNPTWTVPPSKRVSGATTSSCSIPQN